MDIFAAFRVASAAASTENPAGLIQDAETVYGAYVKIQAKQLDLAKMPPDQLRLLIKAAARLAHVGEVVADNPDRLKDLVTLLGSMS